MENDRERTCVIFGGAGYIGTKWCERLLDTKHFDKVVLVDTRPSSLKERDGVSFHDASVIDPMNVDLESYRPSWIFNFAAVHREPGHEFEEYFDTNIPGAENICSYADKVGCKNILFTSSIAVYGPTKGPTSEATTKYPSTGYGISKLLAEKIHETWAAASSDRRLVVCRPGVIYGPGDPGNILRMIKAVKKGVFFFPGSPNIHKSYGYVAGLLDSFEFTLKRKESLLHYNYVETPTEPLNELVKHIEQLLDRKTRTLPLPLWALVPVAIVIQKLTGGKSPIHPKRVRKAATPTHIIPQTLMDLGFNFKYDFARSLSDWEKISPEDF